MALLLKIVEKTLQSVSGYVAIKCMEYLIKKEDVHVTFNWIKMHNTCMICHFASTTMDICYM